MGVNSFRTQSLPLMAGLICFCFASNAPGAILFETGFEPPDYTVGNLHGQDGWIADIGPLDLVFVGDTSPVAGVQEMYIYSDGAVVGTGAYRDLVYDASGQILTLNSMIELSNVDSRRSRYEFSSVFGTDGHLGGLQVLPTKELVLVTGLDTVATGVFADLSVAPYSLEFNFETGFASATVYGVNIASDVPFDVSNSSITQVAAARLIDVDYDAIRLDDFSVTATAASSSSVPEPAGISLMGIGAGLMGCARRRRRTQSHACPAGSSEM